MSSALPVPVPAIQDVLMSSDALRDVDFSEFCIATRIEFDDQLSQDGEFVMRRQGKTLIAAHNHPVRNDMTFLVVWRCFRGPDNRWSLDRMLMSSDPPHDPQDAESLMMLLDQTMPIGDIYCTPFGEESQ